MSESPSARVPEGHPLRVLRGGLTIVRYLKHEWVPGFEELPPDRSARRTDKVYGSKFLAAWNLDRLVDWMDLQIQRAGWTFQPGTRYKLDVRLAEPVGLVFGKIVHTIRIVSDGRYAHAYPIEDAG